MDRYVCVCVCVCVCLILVWISLCLFVFNVQYLCQCVLDHSVTFIVAVGLLTCLHNMYSVVYKWWMG